MRKKSRLIAGTLGGLLLVGATAGATYAVQAESGVTSSTSDALVTTTASTNLSASGGVSTVVESMKVPKGTWVLHADNTVVNFANSDYTRCALVSGTTSLNAHATMVGGSGGAGSVVLATLSETASVTLTSGTIISVQCSHDSTNGATPYVDTGAVLWAHRGTSVVATTTP
jgi:hypothetical protein